MPMKIAKILPLLTGYRKSYSVGLIQIAYFGNTLKKNSSLILFCFPLSARLEQARFGSTVQPLKQGHQWGRAMCLHNSGVVLQR